MCKSYNHPSKYFLIPFCIFFFNTFHCPVFALDPDATDAIIIFQKHRETVIEAGTALANEEIEKLKEEIDQPNSPKFQIGKHYYSQAKSSWNAWLDTIILELKHVKNIDEVDYKIGALSEAVEKTVVLKNYVWPPKSSTPSLFKNSNNSDTLFQLLAAIINICAIYCPPPGDGQGPNPRDGMLAQLKDSKIPDFEDILKKAKEIRL